MSSDQQGIHQQQGLSCEVCSATFNNPIDAAGHKEHCPHMAEARIKQEDDEPDNVFYQPMQSSSNDPTSYERDNDEQMQRGVPISEREEMQGRIGELYDMIDKLEREDEAKNVRLKMLQTEVQQKDQQVNDLEKQLCVAKTNTMAGPSTTHLSADAAAEHAIQSIQNVDVDSVSCQETQEKFRKMQKICKANAIQCPAGYDQDVFDDLPIEMQMELSKTNPKAMEREFSKSKRGKREKERMQDHLSPGEQVSLLMF